MGKTLNQQRYSKGGAYANAIQALAQDRIEKRLKNLNGQESSESRRQSLEFERLDRAFTDLHVKILRNTKSMIVVDAVRGIARIFEDASEDKKLEAIKTAIKNLTALQ